HIMEPRIVQNSQPVHSMKNQPDSHGNSHSTMRVQRKNGISYVIVCDNNGGTSLSRAYVQLSQEHSQHQQTTQHIKHMNLNHIIT
ncbi:hypothetical protein PV327_011642, partial [Microctonus hyperodae]